MFFRTKRKTAELFTLSSSERRDAFRVRPAADAPIELRMAGQQVTVNDISAGGLSVTAPGLAAGDRERTAFRLPGLDVEVPVGLEVVSVDPGDIVHCRFFDLEKAFEDAIHLYVLQRQKDQIRKEEARTP